MTRIEQNIINNKVHLHPAFERVAQQLTIYIKDGLSPPEVTGAYRSLKWILGPSRSGKTQVVDYVHAKFQKLESTDSDNRRMIPVLKVTMRSGGSKGGLAMAILDSLKMAGFARGSVADKFDLAIRQLELHKVKVLIIDEIQQLTDAGRSKSIRGAADVLKELFERVPITFIFVGLPNAEELCLNNTQLANRSERRVMFMPYDYSDQDQMKEFVSAVRGYYDGLVTDPYNIEIGFKTFARALYYLSAGRFGLVSNFMHTLQVEFLRTNGKFGINKNLLGAAAEKIAVDFDLDGNPFDREISDREFSVCWERMILREDLSRIVGVNGRLAHHV